MPTVNEYDPRINGKMACWFCKTRPIADKINCDEKIKMVKVLPPALRSNGLYARREELELLIPMCESCARIRNMKKYTRATLGWGCLFCILAELLVIPLVMIILEIITRMPPILLIFTFLICAVGFIFLYQFLSVQLIRLFLSKPDQLIWDINSHNHPDMEIAKKEFYK